MGGKGRYLVSGVLLALGLFFVYLHFSKPASQPGKPEEKKYWRFKLTDKQPSETVFFCQGGRYYSFKSEHGIRAMRLGADQKPFDMRDAIGTSPDYFKMFFPRDMQIGITAKISGIYHKTGLLEIWEGATKEFGELFLALPKQYSRTLCKTGRGKYFSIPFHKEIYYLGLFKDDKLVKELLIKPNRRAKSTTEVAYDNNNNMTHFCFFQDGEVRLKAAEVPMVAYLSRAPKLDQMNFEISAEYQMAQHFQKKLECEAIYLDPGQTKKTDFWLDKGDTFTVSGQDILDLGVAVGGGGFRRLDPSYAYQNQIEGQAPDSGYMAFKANRKCRIYKVTVNHRQGWELNLKPGQTWRTAVYPGDIIKTVCRSRYFVNNVIQEPGEKVHQIDAQTPALEIKQSIGSDQIFVKVMSRRGY